MGDIGLWMRGDSFHDLEYTILLVQGGLEGDGVNARCRDIISSGALNAIFMHNRRHMIDANNHGAVDGREHLMKNRRRPLVPM